MLRYKWYFFILPHSANNIILFFKINFKPSLRLLEEYNQDVSETLLAKTVQSILRQQVVEHAGNLILSILSETVVILGRIHSYSSNIKPTLQTYSCLYIHIHTLDACTYTYIHRCMYLYIFIHI